MTQRPTLLTRLATVSVISLCAIDAAGQTSPEDANPASPALPATSSPATTPTPAVGSQTTTVTTVAPSGPTGAMPEAPAATAAATPIPAAPALESTVFGPIVAGFHGGRFFMSNAAHDWFLSPSGRLHLDGYGFVGDRITDDYTTASGAFHRGDVKDGFILRRARLEVVGGFFGRFTFMLGAEFASAATPEATDDFFNARIHPMLNLQLGQFDAPFTLENRTSDKYIDFMERSLAVLALGIPTNKELGLMAWGETTNRVFYYSVGAFNGDGQNRTNRDNNVDVMGRVFAHPLITLGGPLRNLQIGGSFRYGVRGRSVDYAYSAMTTQAGWTFFNPQFGGANPGVIVPDATQLGVAGELDLPINRFDLRAEFIYVHNDTREMALPTSGAALTLAGDARLAGDAQRLGDLTGVGYYLQLGYWIWGDVGVNGRPGYQNPPALVLNQPEPAAQMGLQLVARLDVVDFRYSGGSRGTTSAATIPAVDGRYSVYAAEFGANFWATKQLRFTVDYIQYFFPGQPTGGIGVDDNHAHGPTNNAASFGEITARVGLAL